MPPGHRRHALLATLIALCALVFAWVVHRHEPIQGWLFFRYLRAGALAALFFATCLISGHAVLVRVLGRPLPLDEHLPVACALGVLLFFLTSFGFGMAGLYGAPFFLFGPCLLLALGSRDFLRTLARLLRHSKRLDWRLSPSPLQGVLLAAGCLCIGLLWFSILTPQNASFDSRWYHLPVAENYVAQKGIVRYSEGWVPGAFPQLASLLYAWAFSMPGALFDRIVTAAHLELAVFVMTLLGIAPIVRRVLGGRVPASWVALFLFPGIFCYDSGLVLGADHIAAVFTAPVFLLGIRYLEGPSRDYAPLLGAAVAGALNTKYTAVIVLPLVAAVVVMRAARDLRRGPKVRIWAPLAAVVLTTVVLTTPHWLKNLIFYGDPLFPALRRWLPARPWQEAAEVPHAMWFYLHSPPFTLTGVLDMAKALVTFSFVPRDFPVYHRDVPVFGSLFTLCTPLLVFLGWRRRLCWLFLGTYLGIAAWFWIHQFERYLQVLVPWMAAAVASVLVLLWREGGAVRIAAVGLVGLQVVWGAAVPFIPSHRASGGQAIQKLVIDLLGRSFRQEGDKPLASYPEWEAIGRALPAGAKVLVHEEEAHTGLSAASALDYAGDQGAFYWGEPGAAAPAEIWKLLRAHGITHLLFAKNLDHGTDTVAAGLAFFEFATHYTQKLGTFGGFVLTRLAETPPPATPPREVAYYPCDLGPRKPAIEPWNPMWRPHGDFRPPFAAGLYPLGAMARMSGDRRPIATPISNLPREQAMNRAHFLVYDARCNGPLPDATRERFELLAARGQAMMMVRKSE